MYTIIWIIIWNAIALAQQKHASALGHAVRVRILLHNEQRMFVGEIAFPIAWRLTTNGRRAVRRLRVDGDKGLGQ